MSKFRTPLRSHFFNVCLNRMFKKRTRLNEIGSKPVWNQFPIQKYSLEPVPNALFSGRLKSEQFSLAFRRCPKTELFRQPNHFFSVRNLNVWISALYCRLLVMICSKTYDIIHDVGVILTCRNFEKARQNMRLGRL